MKFYNNKLGIYITDEQITIYDSNNRILTGLFCTKQNDKLSIDDGNNTHYYQFYGSVVADFNACKSILKAMLMKCCHRFILELKHTFRYHPVVEYQN